jgi:hypothetical protein
VFSFFQSSPQCAPLRSNNNRCQNPNHWFLFHDLTQSRFKESLKNSPQRPLSTSGCQVKLPILKADSKKRDQSSGPAERPIQDPDRNTGAIVLVSTTKVNQRPAKTTHQGIPRGKKSTSTSSRTAGRRCIARNRSPSRSLSASPRCHRERKEYFMNWR